MILGPRFSLERTEAYHSPLTARRQQGAGRAVSALVGAILLIRKVQSEWRVAHEHGSAPLDPMIGRAAFTLDVREQPGRAAAHPPCDPLLVSAAAPVLNCRTAFISASEPVRRLIHSAASASSKTTRELARGSALAPTETLSE